MGIEFLGDDLEIVRVKPRPSVGGAWVEGHLNGHDFRALIFPDHAAEAGYELGDSRISKLWVRRSVDRAVVYEFDRGVLQPAAGEDAGRIVGFLEDGLAEYVFGG